MSYWKSLVCLAVVAAAAPAFGVVDFFPVTMDGSFNTHHGEGYGNGGKATTLRFEKAYQQMGFLDWEGSVGDTSLKNLAQFITDNGGYIRSATLFVRNRASGITDNAAIITLRTGNDGNVVLDTNTNWGKTYSAPATGVVGATECPAWRMGNTPYAYNGDFNGGTPWKIPSTATANPSGFAAGADVTWNLAGGVAGFDGNRIWALDAVVGISSTSDVSVNTLARFEAAGQMVNKDASGNPVVLSPAGVGAGDPRGKSGSSADWVGTALSAAIVQDVATNLENKGLVFTNYTAFTPLLFGLNEIYSMENATSAPYIMLDVVPEPATLCLLTLGGLALLRRRA